ncbi:HTH-type transcriptional regulator KdgR [subsurface metagenome]
MARSLKLRHTNTIGLLITDITNPLYSYLADGVLSGANRHGYHVVFCENSENPEMEKEYIKVLLEKRVAGIIAVPIGYNRNYWQENANFGIEVVFVDRKLRICPILIPS